MPVHEQLSSLLQHFRASYQCGHCVAMSNYSFLAHLNDTNPWCPLTTVDNPQHQRSGWPCWSYLDRFCSCSFLICSFSTILLHSLRSMLLCCMQHNVLTCNSLYRLVGVSKIGCF